MHINNTVVMLVTNVYEATINGNETFVAVCMARLNIWIIYNIPLATTVWHLRPGSTGVGSKLPRGVQYSMSDSMEENARHDFLNLVIWLKSWIMSGLAVLYCIKFSFEVCKKYVDLKLRHIIIGV